MANQQIAAGGSGTLTMTGTGSPGSTSWTIKNSAGTVIATSTAFGTANNGWNVTPQPTSSGTNNVTVTAPSSASVATNYTLTGSVSGVATYGTTTFDVVAAAAPSAPTITAANGQGCVNITIPQLLAGQTLNIYRGATSGGEGTTPVTSSVGPTSGTAVVQDSGAPIGSISYYTATLSNSTGTSPASTEVSATAQATSGTGSQSGNSNTVTVTPNPVPNAPTNLVGTAGNNQVALAWTPPASGTYGHIVMLRRVTVQSGAVNAWSVLATIPVASGNSYVDTTCLNNTTYDYTCYATP